MTTMSVLVSPSVPFPGRVNSASPSQAVVSIRDDDDPSVAVSFGQATYTVAEGGTVAVKVTLTATRSGR